ncbi:MAG: hypothetical protein RLZZ618_401 [Pseudomonadota bacterium]
MLVLLQTLGAMHAVVHAPAAPSAVSRLSSAGQADAELFASHQAHSTDCQLFDQLAHADLAWAPPAVWTPAVHSTPPNAVRGTPSAAAEALAFRARAPPAVA